MTNILMNIKNKLVFIMIFYNLNYLKIIFYRLWSASKFSLEFIRDFLTDEELNILCLFKSITQNLVPLIP